MSGKFGPERVRGQQFPNADRVMKTVPGTPISRYLDAAVDAGMTAYGDERGLPRIRWYLQRRLSGESTVTGQVSASDYDHEAAVVAARAWADHLGLVPYEPDSWEGTLDDGHRIEVWGSVLAIPVHSRP